MLRTLMCLLLTCGCACVSAADAVEQFKDAMAGDDYQAKKTAISRLASVQDDDQAYSLLISALSDRQAQRLAVEALRRRSGLSAPRGQGARTGYPGYPGSDDASGWSAWNNKRKEELADKAAIEEAKQVAEEAKKAAEAATEQAEKGEEDEAVDNGETAEGDDTEGPTITAEADVDVEGYNAHWGKLDRIIFNDGTIMIGYVTVKRRNLTGQLTSIHVVHKDGDGEEDIDASLITRVQEDIE